MIYFITIIVNCDDVRAIYVGKSEKEAEKIAKEFEDVEKGIYCYVSAYNSKKKGISRGGFRKK